MAFCCSQVGAWGPNLGGSTFELKNWAYCPSACLLALLIAQNTQQGAASMQKLLDSKEQNLMLADHAKDWSWVEVEEPKDDEVKTKAAE